MQTQTLLNEIWAKGPHGNERSESLIEHTYKVISALAQIKRRSPYIPNLGGKSRLWHWVFWSCFLHDFGKTAKSFQSYLRGQSPFWRHRHEIFSLAFMQALEFEEDDFPWIVAGIASHHKDANEILEGRYDLLLEPEDLALEELIIEIDEGVVYGLITWLKETPTNWIQKNGFDDVEIPAMKASLNIKDFVQKIPEIITTSLHAYNNFVSHIAEEPFTSVENRAAIFLRGLVVQADHLASANAPEIKTISFPNSKDLARRLGLIERDWRSHQKEASRAIGSIILLAPTGSGKTEAALLWAHNQQIISGIQRHLIYILPYQASLNAIYKRFKDIISCEIALIHGRSLQAIYRELQNKGYSGKKAEIAAKRSNDFARLYQPPIWCITPYQLLRAAYRLPGYEALWTSMAGALVVIDEVHAYEPSRLGMFLALLIELKERWGIELCVMTATMPSWLKSIMISIVSNEIPVDEELFNTFKRHWIEIIEGNIFSPKVHQLIQKEVLSGNSMLIGVNTVKTAQKIKNILDKFLEADLVILIHSRFTARDRLIKEAEIMEKLGTKKDKSLPIVVIATQVIEVSLDLNFDTIITEPAPLEALIQRFGRINRQGRKGIVPVKVLTQSIDDEKVYNRDLVSRAISVLMRNKNSVINELKINEWLDDIYVGIEDKFINEVSRHKEEFQDSCLKTLRAFDSSPTLAERFDELFDNTEVLPKCLEKEFEQLYEQSIIEAKSLLVPISWKQLCKNKDFIVWNSEWSIRIIDKPYNSKRGLLF